MPSLVTRKASNSLPRYKHKATISQLVLALRRKIVWEESFSDACAHANACNPALSETNRVSRTTLHKLYHSLPEQLRSPLHASEAALLNFIQQQQCIQRSKLKQSHQMLTQLEEELLCQWLVEMDKVNLPLSAPRIIQEARRIIEIQTGTAKTSSMKSWYRLFKQRHPELTECVCRDTPSVTGPEVSEEQSSSL